jgi:hypothetical protein
MRVTLWLLIALLVAATQAACSKSNVDSGAGSGGSSVPSNNWDSMIWNQGTWQ